MVTVQVIDGADTVQDTGERIIEFALDLSWQGDGSTLTVELPPQTAQGFYETSDGLRINVSVQNFDSDFMSVSNGNVDLPATLDFKLAALIAKVEGFLPSSFVRAGTYTLVVEFDGVPLGISRENGSGTLIDAIDVTFTLQ